VLTGLLATRCENLLSVDASEVPLAKARERLQNAPHVTIAQMQVPAIFPKEKFDLVVVSEVGYYWSWQDLEKAQRAITESLLPGGHLLLVHWTPYVEDYPLTGDEVHDTFHRYGQEVQQWKHLTGKREEKYRLDLWEV
jgi:SAM-dependent methyltransferase